MARRFTIQTDRPARDGSRHEYSYKSLTCIAHPDCKARYQPRIIRGDLEREDALRRRADQIAGVKRRQEAMFWMVEDMAQPFHLHALDALLDKTAVA